MPSTRAPRSIRLSPQLASVLGRPALQAELAPRITAKALLRQLGVAHPEILPLLPTALVVAADRVLAPGDRIPADTELALLHPSAGG